MDFLGDLLVRLVPVAIPIILIWSFLINHGLAPSSGSKKSENKGKDASKDKPAEESKPPKQEG